MTSKTKSKLLIATALASLLAGIGVASAQSSNEEHSKTPGAKSPAATEHAPSAPHAQSPTQPGGTMGNRVQGNAPSGPNRMGQSEPNRSGKSDRMDAQKPSAQTNKSESDRNRGTAQTERGRNDNRGAADNRGRTEENRGTAQHEGNRGKSVSLSTEQRTKIRETVLHERSAPRLARNDLNINLSIGERIPRDRIHIRPLPLPASIVEIEPEWRGYEYFLVGDEVVVVDPDTLEIVAVIPA